MRSGIGRDGVVAVFGGGQEYFCQPCRRPDPIGRGPLVLYIFLVYKINPFTKYQTLCHEDPLHSRSQGLAFNRSTLTSSIFSHSASPAHTIPYHILTLSQKCKAAIKLKNILLFHRISNPLSIYRGKGPLRLVWRIWTKREPCTVQLRRIFLYCKSHATTDK